MATKSNGNGKQITVDELDQRIEKAQKRVDTAKHAYDIALKKLNEMKEKRDLLKKEQLDMLITNSKHSYEEIVSFLSSEPKVMCNTEQAI